MRKKTAKLFIAIMVMLSVSFTVSAAGKGHHAHHCGNWDSNGTTNACVYQSHHWGRWNVKKSATIFRKGSKIHECTYCGKTQTKTIAKLKPYARFSKKTIELRKSKSQKLKVDYAKGDSVKRWNTSNKKVVTVSKSGKIMARKNGTAKITVTMRSGKKATCTIKVFTKKKTSASSNKGTVYWVANGKVYHNTRNCASLKRSSSIRNGSIANCPKNRPCKLCY